MTPFEKRVQEILDSMVVPKNRNGVYRTSFVEEALREIVKEVEPLVEAAKDTELAQAQKKFVRLKKELWAMHESQLSTLRAENERLKSDVNVLNELVRGFGPGQGEIDFAASQEEEIASLRAENERLRMGVTTEQGRQIAHDRWHDALREKSEEIASLRSALLASEVREGKMRDGFEYCKKMAKALENIALEPDKVIALAGQISFKATVALSTPPPKDIYGVLKKVEEAIRFIWNLSATITQSAVPENAKVALAQDIKDSAREALTSLQDILKEK